MKEPWEECPPRARLAAYVRKELEGRLNEWTYRHLKFCARCLETVSELKRVPDPEEIIASGSPWARLKRWVGRWFKQRR